MAAKEVSRAENRERHLQYMEDQKRYREESLKIAQENRIAHAERDADRGSLVSERGRSTEVLKEKNYN